MRRARARRATEFTPIALQAIGKRLRARPIGRFLRGVWSCQSLSRVLNSVTAAPLEKIFTAMRLPGNTCFSSEASTSGSVLPASRNSIASAPCRAAARCCRARHHGTSRGSPLHISGHRGSRIVAWHAQSSAPENCRLPSPREAQRREAGPPAFQRRRNTIARGWWGRKVRHVNSSRHHSVNALIVWEVQTDACFVNHVLWDLGT